MLSAARNIFCKCERLTEWNLSPVGRLITLSGSSAVSTDQCVMQGFSVGGLHARSDDFGADIRIGRPDVSLDILAWQRATKACGWRLVRVSPANAVLCARGIGDRDAPC